MRKVAGKVVFAVFFLSIALLGALETVAQDVTESGIVRLHVVAHSNKESDQAAKYAVRDALLTSGLADTPALAAQNKQALCDLAQNVLKEHGLNYGAAIYTGRFYFPKKSYRDITLPQGEYDAVRVVLGDGAGENWWCVMYPPLCFLEDARGELEQDDKEALLSSLLPLTKEAILNDGVRIKPALKATELWQSVKKKAKEHFKNGKQLILLR